MATVYLLSLFSFAAHLSLNLSQVGTKYREALVRHCNGKSAMDLFNFKVRLRVVEGSAGVPLVFSTIKKRIH